MEWSEIFLQAGVNGNHQSPSPTPYNFHSPEQEFPIWTADNFYTPMTLYRHINETDSWKFNEIHVSKLSDLNWFLQAKLKNGRIANMFWYGPQPTEEIEPELLLKLIQKDWHDQIREWFVRLWLKLTRCYFCRCR